MLKDWPQADRSLADTDAAARMEGVMEIIRTIRNLRAEMNVAPSKRTRLMLLPAEGWSATLEASDVFFRRLAGASESHLIASAADAGGKTVSAVTHACTLYIPLGDLVDFEKELARLGKEEANLVKEIARAEGKLNNPGFVGKAPAALVAQEKEKLSANQAKLEALRQRIGELKAGM